MSKYLIIGSFALRNYVSIDPKKRLLDFDVMSKDPIEINSEGKPIEFHWFGEASEWLLDRNKDPKYLDKDFLYTLKVSHAAWDIHWDKTMFDIFQLKKAGSRLNRELFDLLIPVWEKLHRPRELRLKENDSFFTDKVKRIIDHDHLHEIVAFPNRPANEFFRTDIDSAVFSKEKFKAASKEQLFATAIEEAQVIALERFLLKETSLPNKNLIQQSVTIALKKLITTMSRGEFNLFLIQNQSELIVELRSDISTIVRSWTQVKEHFHEYNRNHQTDHR